MKIRTVDVWMMLLCFVVLTICEVGRAASGEWSAFGKLPHLHPDSATRDFTAPNELVSVRVSTEGFQLVSRGEIVALKEVSGLPSLSEILWNPNSRAVAITTSDGGLVGTWQVYVYLPGDSAHPTYRDVKSLVGPLAVGLPKCETNEVPNIGAVNWSKNGGELMIVAEVPPHSSCRNMGAIEGFRISVKDWRVIARVPEGVLRKKWRSDLGNRLVKQPAD